MNLRDEVQAIISNDTMSYEAKRQKLLTLMTEQEVRALLPKPKNGTNRPKSQQAKVEDINVKVDIVIYDQRTDEVYDQKSLELPVTDKQVREVAKVMDRHGGFAPELSMFTDLDSYLFEKSTEYYQLFYAPDDDDFWDTYMLTNGEKVPDAVLQAAEKYVTHKVAEVVYYYYDGCAERSRLVEAELKPATFFAMIEAAKKNHQGKTDFDYLKEVNTDAYGQVHQAVAAKLGSEVTEFALKEFPYKVLELAMMDAEPTEETDGAGLTGEPEVEEVFIDEKHAPVIRTWKWAVSDLRVATSKDWKNRPMARDRHYVIRTDIPIPKVAMERIRQGHIPGQMEDKWFMYFENGVIRYYRSWTGSNTFNAYCEEREDGYAITKIEVDMEDYDTNPRCAPEALNYFLHTLAWHCGVSMDCPVSISSDSHSKEEDGREEKPFKECFKDYLFAKRKEATARVYISMIDNTLRRFIKHHVDDKADSVFSYTTPEELSSLVDRLKGMPAFATENEQKHGAITAALKMYEQFVKEQQ